MVGRAQGMEERWLGLLSFWFNWQAFKCKCQKYILGRYAEMQELSENSFDFVIWRKSVRRFGVANLSSLIQWSKRKQLM